MRSKIQGGTGPEPTGGKPWRPYDCMAQKRFMVKPECVGYFREISNS